MSVRPAKPSDIPRLIETAKEGLAQSIYRNKGGIDEDYARRLFAVASLTHGGMNCGDMFLLVSHTGDDIQGYFLGFLDRVYQIGDRLAATEIHTYMTPRGSRRDGIAMIGEFVDWAMRNDAVIEILIGKTLAISANGERYEKMLVRKGFEEFGKFYRKDISARSALGDAAA